MYPFDTQYLTHSIDQIYDEISAELIDAIWRQYINFFRCKKEENDAVVSSLNFPFLW